MKNYDKLLIVGWLTYEEIYKKEIILEEDIKCKTPIAIKIMKRLGMEVYISGPEEYKEEGYDYINLDDVIDKVDIVMLLRVQHERHADKMQLTEEEYNKNYGLNKERVKKMKKEAIIMHPAPFNRNVEITDDIVECEKSRIFKQVENGVFVRMALINMVLGE